jgi:hypothetical protein
LRKKLIEKREKLTQKMFGMPKIEEMPLSPNEIKYKNIYFILN